MKTAAFFSALVLTALLAACGKSPSAPQTQPQPAPASATYRAANSSVNFDQNPGGLVDQTYASTGILFTNFLAQNLTANEQILVPSKLNYILLDDSKSKARIEAS